MPVDAELRRLCDSLTLAEDDGKKLTVEQSNVQKLTGELRWQLNVVIHITRHVHRLSCISARPQCPDAMRVALGTLVYAWHVRNCGLTYGGEFGTIPLMGVLRGTLEGGKSGRSVQRVDPAAITLNAPEELLACSDATWNAMSNAGVVADVLAFALTHRGAAIHIELKNAGASGSSAGQEGLAILKCTDKLIRAREVLAACGAPQDAATLLMSDSDPALRTAAGQSTASRTRHDLRRTAIVTGRVRDGECTLAHIPDEGNMVDWMTKWVKMEKLRNSLEFLTGERSRLLHMAGDATSAAFHAMVLLVRSWI